VLHIYIYDISSLSFNDLTFILLTWRKWLAPNNASRQQMGFNSEFKGLKKSSVIPLLHWSFVDCYRVKFTFTFTPAWNTKIVFQTVNIVICNKLCYFNTLLVVSNNATTVIRSRVISKIDIRMFYLRSILRKF